MTSLLDVVDDLTLPKHTTVMQDVMTATRDADGNDHLRPTGRRTKATVTTPPLLTQLQEAIRSSIGGTAGGASLAHERSMLDSEALHQAMIMTNTIGDWCGMVGARHDRTNPATSLRAWYATRLATNPTQASDDWYENHLRGWVGFIWSKLDPVRERDLPDGCPVCGATEWWRAGERYPRPLVVRYRGNDPDMIERARALCRACEQVWSVRELAYELEQATGGNVSGRP